MFQDFLKRKFYSNPKRSQSELVTMKQLRSDRMVMSSRATTFEADYKASKGINHKYAGLGEAKSGSDSYDDDRER
jgi:hypothetical protein